jgi:hypothetical protein
MNDWKIRIHLLLFFVVGLISCGRLSDTPPAEPTMVEVPGPPEPTTDARPLEPGQTFAVDVSALDA